MILSRKFYVALKTADIPAYKLAAEAGIHPSFLSSAAHGRISVKPGDRRLLKIGKRLGLKPDEVFDETGEGS
jgi:hypothetical protein